MNLSYFRTPKSQTRAASIHKLLTGRVMTAGQIAAEMDCSIQSLRRYLQPMVERGTLYSGGKQRGCPLYTASAELSRHPSEIIGLVVKPKREPRPPKVKPAPVMPRHDPLISMFFGWRV